MANFWEQDAVADDAGGDQWWNADTVVDQFKPKTPTTQGQMGRRPYIDRVSKAAGFPVLPEPDLPYRVRADLGISDTFTEKQAKFKDYYPDALFYQQPVPGKQNPEVIYQMPGDERRLLDEPGVVPADILDRPQEIATMMMQGAAAAFGPPGWVAQGLLQAGAPVLTHLVKEGVETGRGYQQEPVTSVLGQAALEGVMDLGAGMAMAAPSALIRGPAKEPIKKLKDDYQAIQDFRALETGIAEPMPYQYRPDKMIPSRLGAQLESTSEAAQARLAAQEQSASDFLQSARKQQLGKAGVRLTREAENAMNKQKLMLRRDFNLDPETAGAAIQGTFTDEFNKRSRAAINKAYADAGTLAEGVSFDLTGAQATAKRVTAPTLATKTDMVDGALVDMQGKPLTQEAVQSYINVAASPGEKVGRVSKLLSVIDPEQQNWEVVKELRSQVGEAIKDIPNEDAVSGQAKAIYRELTGAIENPIGGAPQFKDAWRKANGLAKNRFDTFQNDRVLQLMTEASPSQVATDLATDPHLLNPVVRGAVDSYVPEKRAIFSKAFKNRLLGDPNAAGLLDQWDRLNPKALSWLLPSKKDQTQFRSLVRKADNLKKLPIEKFIQSSSAMIDRGAEILKNTGPAELEQTIRMLGGRKSESFDAMRMFAFDDIMGRAQVMRDGVPSINPQKLSDAINDYQRRGIWDKVLTKEDKTRIRGLDAYARRVFKSAADTGTSLEQAQAIAALKHPSTFMQGVHALAVNNRVLAPLMMHPKWGKLLAKPPTATGGMKRGRGTVPWMTFTGNFMEGVNDIINEDFGREL